MDKRNNAAPSKRAERQNDCLETIKSECELLKPSEYDYLCLADINPLPSTHKRIREPYTVTAELQDDNQESIPIECKLSNPTATAGQQNASSEAIQIESGELSKPNEYIKVTEAAEYLGLDNLINVLPEVPEYIGLDNYITILQSTDTSEGNTVPVSTIVSTSSNGNAEKLPASSNNIVLIKSIKSNDLSETPAVVPSNRLKGKLKWLWACTLVMLAVLVLSLMVLRFAFSKAEHTNNIVTSMTNNDSDCSVFDMKAANGFNCSTSKVTNRTDTKKDMTAKGMLTQKPSNCR